MYVVLLKKIYNNNKIMVKKIEIKKYFFSITHKEPLGYNCFYALKKLCNNNKNRKKIKIKKLN